MEKSANYKKKFKTNFVFLADEFFVKGEREIPKKEYYEDFEHLENGVGLLRLLLDDFMSMLVKYYGDKKEVPQ